MKLLKYLLFYVILGSLGHLGRPSLVCAQEYLHLETPRFTLYVGSLQDDSASVTFQREDIVRKTLSVLDETHEELQRIFQSEPENKVVLRFLNLDDFRRSTGAPAWTSAMYFRGEITIPVRQGGINPEELRSSIRHEYVHAFISSLSASRCPAWLDEGLAQLIEGEPNPRLGPALRKWTKDNAAMPLSWLDEGFMTLEYDYVPAAYAQSLFATRSLVNRFGFSAIRNYLTRLHEGQDKELSFETAFNLSLSEFENKLTTQIRIWASSNRRQP